MAKSVTPIALSVCRPQKPISFFTFEISLLNVFTFWPTFVDAEGFGFDARLCTTLFYRDKIMILHIQQ